MEDREHTGGWSRSEEYIRAEIKRLSEAVEALTEKVIELRLDVREMRTRALIWSGLMGLVIGAAFKYVIG